MACLICKLFVQTSISTHVQLGTVCTSMSMILIQTAWLWGRMTQPGKFRVIQRIIKKGNKGNGSIWPNILQPLAANARWRPGTHIYRCLSMLMTQPARSKAQKWLDKIIRRRPRKKDMFQSNLREDPLVAIRRHNRTAGVMYRTTCTRTSTQSQKCGLYSVSIDSLLMYSMLCCRSV